MQRGALAMSVAAVTTAALGAMLGCIFIGAGIDKLRRARESAVVIDAYALLPPGAGRWLARPLGAAEFAAGVAVALPLSRAGGAAVVALLLLIYSCAVARAVQRGDTDFDCGCGPLGRHVPPGAGVLVRNAVLLAIALALAVVAAPPPAGALAWSVAGVFCALDLLLYNAANLLLARDSLLADD